MSFFATYDVTRNTFWWANAQGLLMESAKAAFDEDQWTFIPSVRGGGARCKNGNTAGKFTVQLHGSDPTNALWSAAARADFLGGAGVTQAQFKDGTGTSIATGANCWVPKIPDLERGKEIGMTEWVFQTDALDLLVGGTT